MAQRVTQSTRSIGKRRAFNFCRGMQVEPLYSESGEARVSRDAKQSEQTFLSFRHQGKSERDGVSC